MAGQPCKSHSLLYTRPILRLTLVHRLSGLQARLATDSITSLEALHPGAYSSSFVRVESLFQTTPCADRCLRIRGSCDDCIRDSPLLLAPNQSGRLALPVSTREVYRDRAPSFRSIISREQALQASPGSPLQTSICGSLPLLTRVHWLGNRSLDGCQSHPARSHGVHHLGSKRSCKFTLHSIYLAASISKLTTRRFQASHHLLFRPS